MAETTTTTAIPELTQYLERLLAAGNYDAVKQLLEPEQPADAAEAIGNLPTLQQAIAFRLRIPRCSGAAILVGEVALR
jgi:magnesium transporter